jgi:hypothetical protein
MKQHSLFVFVLCLLSWFWQPITAQAATTVCNPDNATVCIDPQFVQAWQRGGGLRDYGYPMAAATPMRQGTQTFDAQLFERARIEIHRDTGANTQVLLGRIGADVMANQGLQYDVAPANPECTYIPETQHNICGSFLQYWQGTSTRQMSSLQRWGYPLSEAQQMVLEDGSEVIAQWFERGRFELHAESSPPQIMVTRLGALFPSVATGTTVLEQLYGQLNANTLSQQFAAQFTPSPILDLRMNNYQHALEQVLYLYIDRLEKLLYNNYLTQIQAATGNNQCRLYGIVGYNDTDRYPISFCLYQLLTNPDFTFSTSIFSAIHVDVIGSSETIELYYQCTATSTFDCSAIHLGYKPAEYLTDYSYLEKFAIFECGLQGYPNTAEFMIGENYLTYETINNVETNICYLLNTAMQLAGVNDIRQIKSSLKSPILNQFLAQANFASGDANTVTDIAYIKEPPSMVVDPAAMLTTATTIGTGQTFPVTATMSLFWDSDVFVSLPSALVKMHVTVHASEFANFDDAYQWYRYPRWVEPYITITDDDIQTDSNNRLPQMTRVGTGVFEGLYTAYEHLLRNNRSYYIVVTGHNQLATWALADRIALLIDANEPLNMVAAP